MEHHAFEPTGNTMHVAWMKHDTEETGGDNYPRSRWEERFDMVQLDAIMHMPHQLTKGLPGFARRWVLRRASAMPGLHGRFLHQYNYLFFHSEEGEGIGMSACHWVNPDGTREKLW